MSELEKEGLIQRFEYSFELAWKTMKDYLEEQGTIINPVTPRNVIKEAFSAYNRLTVTPTVIKYAKTTYILAVDRSKSKIVEQAKQTTIDINKLPVQMVENRIWCYN